MRTLEELEVAAVEISDERFAELAAMPKGLRLRSWTEREKSAYQARQVLPTYRKLAAEKMKAEAEKVVATAKVHRAHHEYDGYRPHRHGPTYHGDGTEIWEDE